MIVIAHRGLIEGPNPTIENRPDTIESALSIGVHVEVDAWCIDGYWLLGHDGPEHLVSAAFLERPEVWVHCKNIEALTQATPDMHVFWHQDDDYTLTSKGMIWTYPGKPYEETKSIVVLPEREWKDYNAMTETLAKQNLYAVCTDYALSMLRAIEWAKS